MDGFERKHVVRERSDVPSANAGRSRQADLEASSHADGLVRKRGAFRIFELGPAGLVQVSASGTPLPVFI